MIFPLHLVEGQKRKITQKKQLDVSLDAFQLRNVGPAFLSSRIADIKMHPNNDNIWYISYRSSNCMENNKFGYYLDTYL